MTSVRLGFSFPVARGPPAPPPPAATAQTSYDPSHHRPPAPPPDNHAARSRGTECYYEVTATRSVKLEELTGVPADLLSSFDPAVRHPGPDGPDGRRLAGDLGGPGGPADEAGWASIYTWNEDGAGGGAYTGQARLGFAGPASVRLRHGVGLMVYYNGNEYFGQWEDGERHGIGSMLFAKGYGSAGGAAYQGEWSRDAMHGFGTLTYEDGSVYEGEWRGNMWDGYGCLLMAPGPGRTRYIHRGWWRAGAKHGPGCLATCPDSDEPRGRPRLKMEGVWRDDYLLTDMGAGSSSTLFT